VGFAPPGRIILRDQPLERPATLWLLLWQELKRREVHRVAVAYGAVAWLVIQAADLVLPRFGVPERAITVLIVIALLGLPVSMLLAWYWRVSPEASDTPDVAVAGQPFINRLVVIALVVAVLVFVVDWSLPDSPGGDMSIQEAPGNTILAQPAAQALVVLPFVNTGGSAEDGYFADGLSEELIHALGGVPSLRVIGRTSAFSWKGRDVDLREIGRSLDVSHVLEGSVRRQMDRLRVTARLVRAADAAQLWSQSYERTIDDVFVVQDDIAHQVLGALQIVLDDVQRQRMENAGTRDVEAFIAYQKGYELWNHAHASRSIAAGLEDAHAWFETARKRAPTFTAAHFLSADLYIHRLAAPAGRLTREEQTATHARMMGLLEAVIHNPGDPMRRALAGIDYVLFSDDWRPLVTQLRTAANTPGCARALMGPEAGMWLGYAREMADIYRREVACDPLVGIAWWDFVMTTMWSEGPEVALQILGKAKQRVGDYPLLLGAEATAYLAMGDIDAAEAAAERIPMDQDVYGLVTRTGVLAKRGKRDEVRVLIDAWGVNAEFAGSDLRLVAHAQIGDLEAADRMAAEIDARPGGPALLFLWIGTCSCGLPFRMEATPNFAARIQEAGVAWPPPVLVDYPALRQARGDI
jgi:adenylate cyclase